MLDKGQFIEYSLTTSLLVTVFNFKVFGDVASYLLKANDRTADKNI